MTDDDLIDEMARAICCPDKERRCDQDWSCDAMEKYGNKARAALVVAKKEIAAERDAARALADKLAEALRFAISQLNAWAEQETGEGLNRPEWNALLAEYDAAKEADK